MRGQEGGLSARRRMRYHRLLRLDTQSMTFKREENNNRDATEK